MESMSLHPTKRCNFCIHVDPRCPKTQKMNKKMKNEKIYDQNLKIHKLQTRFLVLLDCLRNFIIFSLKIARLREEFARKHESQLS